MTHEPSAEDATRLALDEAKSLARRALERSGLAASHAIAVAAQHVAADRDGIPSHGIARIPSCCELIPIGKIKGDAVPRIASPRPGLIQVDSDDGFPHLAIETGTPPLCEAARRNGVAAMMVANGYHCGVLGYHTERIAASGLVVIGFTAAPASIAPSGGTRPVIGTNPISCAVPCENGPPLVIDQSSSVVAKSEVIDRH
jgi:(2R)-3-sulfolactate dehydrogenase (NADP+)